MAFHKSTTLEFCHQAFSSLVDEDLTEIINYLESVCGGGKVSSSQLVKTEDDNSDSFRVEFTSNECEYEIVYYTVIKSFRVE